MQVKIQLKTVDIFSFPMSALEHPKVFCIRKTINYSVIVLFTYKTSPSSVKAVERFCLKS